jgi:hypothetical protein
MGPGLVADLRRPVAENVLAIDCIEFDERFRVADVSADVAFLSMDLAYQGRVDLAEQRGLTEVARAVLPETVPHADASHTAGRAALLVHALTTAPELLLAATEDRLHQPYRAAGAPAPAPRGGRRRGAGGGGAPPPRRFPAQPSGDRVERSGEAAGAAFSS